MQHQVLVLPRLRHSNSACGGGGNPSSCAVCSRTAVGAPLRERERERERQTDRQREAERQRGERAHCGPSREEAVKKVVSCELLVCEAAMENRI
jgi:hypothetical protein